MSHSTPVLDQLNIVVSNMEGSVRFYRLLGLEVPDTDPAWQQHHRTAVSHSLDIDLDSEAFARTWNAGSTGASANSSVLGFRLPTREAVEELYESIVEAGYRTQQAPYDTFWGSRYAIVEDPDGNPIGLMSPSDPARRTAMQPPSAD